MSRVRWVTAFLDSDEERAPGTERFWCQVTGSVLSPRRGPRGEFATLQPTDGDPYLRVQTVIQSPPGGMHLDLHADDVLGLATRVEELGGSASYLEAGYVVCGSPAGLTFCVVGGPGRERPPPVLWQGGRSQLDQVCIDVPPSRFEAESAFWATLTGWPARQVRPRTEFARLVVPGELPLRFLLQRLEQEQYVATVHLDLAADDRDAEVRRHLDLGASAVRRTEDWTTLRDPAGRAYCVTTRGLD